MKSKKTIMMVLATQFGLATNLMAATGGREDNSSYLVWAFLSMCALIVIVQLTPAIMLTFGMMKALFTSSEQTPAEVQSIDAE